MLRQRDSDPAYAASTTAAPYADYLIEHYGTVTYSCLGPFARVLISDPALVRAVYIAHNGAFHKPMYLRRVLPLFGNGLVTANGDDWAKQRRLLTPAFKHAELKVGVLLGNDKHQYDTHQNDAQCVFHTSMIHSVYYTPV